MRLTFIVTIDPVKDLSLLNVLIHSLNLQTSAAFDVVFYNQTPMTEDAIFARLEVRPTFDYRFYSIDAARFLGKYPLWDLYAFHNTLLDAGLLNEYFMSLHMEEFFDVDYVEAVLTVLGDRRLDILFGNLSGTRLDFAGMRPILGAQTAQEFRRHLTRLGLTGSPHWSFGDRRLFASRTPRALIRDMVHLSLFGFRRRVAPTRKGYRTLTTYMAEDLYFMKREFAQRYNWFLRGHHMYFEDIHICEQKGVCELATELRKITEFPAYFNLARIYHLRHAKYYFQFLDDEFTSSLLGSELDDRILTALKKAIVMYRAGQLTLPQAVQYSRKNPERTGTQNLNYEYHMKYLREAGAAAERARR